MRQTPSQAASALPTSASAKKVSRVGTYSRIDMHINESGGNPELDRQFMMRHSASVGRLGMKTTANDLSYAQRYKQHSSTLFDNGNEQEGDQTRRSEDMKEVREMQKRIARHISQKAFDNRPDSVANLAQQLKEHAVNNEQQQALTSRRNPQAEQAMQARQGHLLRSSNGNGGSIPTSASLAKKDTRVS